MGGKSSSTTQNFTDASSTRNEDYSVQQVESGVGVRGSMNRITVTDAGATRAALEANAKVSGDAVKAAADVSTRAIDASEATLRDGIAQAMTFAERSSKSALDFASNASKGDGAQVSEAFKYGAIAAAVVAGIAVMRGGS